MINKFDIWFESVLNNWLGGGVTPYIKMTAYLIVALFVSWLSFLIIRKFIISFFHKLLEKTENKWDDELIHEKVFHKIARLVPFAIFYSLTPVIFSDYSNIIAFMDRVIPAIMILIVVVTINAVVSAAHKIFNSLFSSKGISISGYIQLVKIFVWVLGFIFAFSALLDKTPTYLLTGLGAIAAVIILVFQDTILGFVASIQLSANKMVKVGDWISMPSRSADGTVLDITLNTVKVQNWDKTIATIPTSALVKESFHNWNGMEESGGRRIKRSLSIDMKSVKFCNDELLAKFEQIDLLKEYISTRRKEIKEHNEKINANGALVINGRQLTNLGVFRKYIDFYLYNNPKIHNDMTFLVRQLQPTDKGIPFEIYVFSNDQAWANYEAIQADIFDHIIAAITEFELNIFQSPSGSDFQRVINS